MKIRPKKNISAIKLYQPGRPIDEVKRSLGLKRVEKMASNENFLKPSAAVMTAIRKSLPEINRYPDGGCYLLREDLAKRFKVRPDQIVVGNGSDEIILLALKAFVAPGDEVVMADPTFLMYRIGAQVVGAQVKAVPLVNYRYDLPSMLRAVTKKTKIIFIANPDNPTGSFIGQDELDSFLKKVPQNVIVFLDEAYYEYAREKRAYPDTMSAYLGKRAVIITRTFSKIYSLAGLRVGYGFSSADIIDSLNRVRDPFNVNAVAQAAARAAMRDVRHVRETLRAMRRGREYLYAEFRRLNVDYIDSATNFILFKVKKNPREIYKALLKNGVIIRDISSWGLKNCLRVTIGSMKENTFFIRMLKKVLEGEPRA